MEIIRLKKNNVANDIKLIFCSFSVCVPSDAVDHGGVGGRDVVLASCGTSRRDTQVHCEKDR